ncbi:hypothetical protein BS47DRAFT_1369106 [Hydnum rufescens UP504]|uniref:Uncharacterized protein n=1 Tax=Hydnum rufescens UP504 TaxID=1448309 RepID=A0A9P6ADR1_9AGAM|nr:hypothetical protein BS47DRAFT_1369106 [Hydnum rufescens UP504]
MCAATCNPQPDPRAQHPNTRTYATTDEIWYHTPAVVGLPLKHETPPNKNTNGKLMCAATHNPIQEPVTVSQNEYHTPALEQCKLLLWIKFKAPETMTDSRNPRMTHTMVNHQATPAQMATNEPSEPPSKPQGRNAQYHIAPSAGCGLLFASGTKRAAIAALFALL